MRHEHRVIAHCPRCDAPIGRSHVLIRYERGDDEALYATCPNCRDVIRPEISDS